MPNTAELQDGEMVRQAVARMARIIGNHKHVNDWWAGLDAHVQDEIRDAVFEAVFTVLPIREMVDAMVGICLFADSPEDLIEHQGLFQKHNEALRAACRRLCVLKGVIWKEDDGK